MKHHSVPFFLATFLVLAASCAHQPTQITLTWRLIYGRTPSASEITSAVEFLTPPPDAPPEIAVASLNLLCQTLLCSNGFLYVE